MRVVNIKELKARLSAYLRDVGKGEEFLVTDRGRVVARLGPPGAPPGTPPRPGEADVLARLLAIGARLPLRERRPGDYRRDERSSGLDPARIDTLLDEARGER